MANPAAGQEQPNIGLRWYENLTENSPVGIFFTDADGNCLQVNRTWCEIAGMSADQATGRGWIAAIHPDDLENVARLWYESARNHLPFHAKYRFRTPQGKTTWVVGRANAKLADDGTVEGYIGTITDIGDLQQALTELEQISSRIQTIIAHMPIMLFAFDEDGHLCAWNHEAQRMTGYPADEMIGNPDALKRLCPDPDYRNRMLKAYRDSGDDFRNWDWELVASDGTVRTISVSSIARFYPIKGWASWGIGQDVTTCRRTEHELRERVKELSCLYKLSMLSNQPNLELDDFFQQAVELLPESWQYPEITTARIIYQEKIFKTEQFTATPWRLASDIHVRGDKVGLIEVYYSEERPLEAEGVFLMEERLLLDEFALQISRTIGHVMARQDMALIHEISAKAEQLERFSHTISHDLRTPLTAIGGFAEFLGNQIAQGKLDQAALCTERIVENTRRMERRLEDILKLAKIGRLIEPTEEVDLQGIITDTLDMMVRRLAKEHITVEVADHFPRVVGDSTRLQEVFENLLDNAIRYIGEEPNRIAIGWRQQGPETVFFIRDNGVGIDPCHFESIFELFTRQVKTIAGEGVGLAISKGIIEAHGGRIWVESEGPGTGSCFCFTFGKVLETRPAR